MVDGTIRLLVGGILHPLVVTVFAFVLLCLGLISLTVPTFSYSFKWTKLVSYWEMLMLEKLPSRAHFEVN
uniref:Uncharacterized protein n=1 Tax=Arundo donax TaxID=35708 RepID=A0A0A9C3C1_ARUDO